jgi:transcription elongation factor GreA
MKKNNVLLTPQGLADLKKEREELKEKKLPEIIARVARAREDGDISENSAYQFGRQEQEFIEGRIEELEEILAGAALIAKPGKRAVVDLGCKVTVSANGRKVAFHIVGDWEAKPKDAKISGSSPLGKALVGKRVGEKAEVSAPAGKVIYTIVAIE